MKGTTRAQYRMAVTLLAYVLVVLAPNLMWLHQASGVAVPYAPLAANLVAIMVVFALGGRLWIGALLLLPLAVLAPVEIFYIHTYGHPSDAHLLGILSETDSGEAGNYLRGAGWMALGAAVIACAACILAARALFLNGSAWPSRIRVWVLLGGGSAGALLAFQNMPLSSAEAAVATDVAYISEMDAAVIGGESSRSVRELTSSYPLGLPFRVAAYMEQRAGLEKAQEALRDFQFGAYQAERSPRRQIHVLVIGETGRPDRWQLNGYARATTPRLANTEGVVSFSDVVSSWAWTRMSVPVLLTRKPDRDTNAFFAEKSLIAAFREAGFKTYWFSTQSPLGKHDSSVALHAHEADEVRFLNPATYSGSGVYDGALLAPLEQVLAREEPKQLIVLHTLGSHFNYADRYPEAFDVFRPSSKGRKDASLHDNAQKVALNNSYDNSVLYTDYFLAEVIKRVNNTRSEATLLYTADHGENLFDGECDKSGHGHATERDFRVASIWWNSRAYEEAWPDKVGWVRKRRSEAVSTGHVFHSMLDAAHIRLPGQNTSRSLLSEEWEPSERWTQGGLDFDTAVREPICMTLKASSNNKPEVR